MFDEVPLRIAIAHHVGVLMSATVVHVSFRPIICHDLTFPLKFISDIAITETSSRSARAAALVTLQEQQEMIASGNE